MSSGLFFKSRKARTRKGNQTTRPSRGAIPGVVIKQLPSFADERGWLCELFRKDELPGGFSPAMAYLSCTLPGVARGPHEHREQTDCFIFLGDYRVYLWDNRAGAFFAERQTLEFGPLTQLWIPPGVVHAYRNIGAAPSFVVNCPDRLYRGPGRREPVDELRYEDDPDSPFQID